MCKHQLRPRSQGNFRAEQNGAERSFCYKKYNALWENWERYKIIRVIRIFLEFLLVYRIVLFIKMHVISIVAIFLCALFYGNHTLYITMFIKIFQTHCKHNTIFSSSTISVLWQIFHRLPISAWLQCVYISLTTHFIIEPIQWYFTMIDITSALLLFVV